VLRKSRLLGIALCATLVASAGPIAAAPEPGPASASLGDATRSITAQLEHVVAAAEDAAVDLAERAEAPPATKKDKKRQQKASTKPQKPSTKRRLKLVKTITGGLTAKSIVADQRGRYYAMNMMYNHTITVFNRRYKRVKTIADSVDLSKFGYHKYDEKVQGAPVEAAVSPDGKRIYVSNYNMYGPGFANPGFDLCNDSDRIDRGFVFEINTRTLRKTDAIQVGEVPKYLAVSPDGRYLLVGNWGSWDISVVDLRKNREIRRIEAGVAPRGIAFSPNGRTAYVTLVGEDRILVIDMKTFKVKRTITGIGERPRHLVMNPTGRYLYITAQGKDKKNRADGRILKYDTRKRKVVARSKALVEPRTTVMSDDGKSLYVVDYYPGTLVKLKTFNLKTIQDKYLGFHPIGVTYDDAHDKLWVSGYGGSVWVLKDK